MNTPRTLSTFLLIVLVIFSQFANAFPVYADDEPPIVPTDVAPTEEPSGTDIPSDSDFPIVDPMSDPATPTEIAPTEEPGETDLPSGSDSPVVDPVDESTTPTDIAPMEKTENLPSEEPSLLEAVQELPAQTDIVVLNENGEVLPLATQEAANVVVGGDPFWCKDGTLPIPASPNCTNSYSTLGELLAFAESFINSQTVGGTIWISAGAISDTNLIVIDGCNTYSGSNCAVFKNWSNYSLTLQGAFDGFNVHGGAPLLSDVVYGENSSFSVPISIINWKNNVTVNNVTVNGATGDGLTVYTAGNINLGNVSVTESKSLNMAQPGNGVYLNNIAGTGSVTINDINTFNNAGVGLDISSKGDITLNNINANSNTDYGAFLYNEYGTGNVTLTGTNTFSNTLGYGTGLHIQSKGQITLNNLTASGNLSSGASLFNEGGTGNVTLTGTNTFNNNEQGLIIDSNGNMELNSIIATGNSWRGAFLYNTGGTGNVTLTGTNNFSSNAKSGLEVNILGNFSSTGTLVANSNGTAHALTDAYGANINATSVTVDGTGNVFSGNYADGLRVITPGIITFSNVTAQSNGTTLQNSSYGYGVYLDNRTSTSEASASISGTNVFSSNYNTGLAVYSNGNIILNNVTSDDSIFGGGAILDNRTSTSNASVSIIGINEFSGNNQTGLSVYSDGNIALNNITANGSSEGAYLDNTTSTGDASVSVSGTNIFSNNNFEGLLVNSNGNITLNNVTSNDSVFGGGAILDNRTSTSNASVSLSGANVFSGNHYNGLWVLSDGNITINNVTANYNIAGTGASLTSNANVTVSGTNMFSNNRDTGLVAVGNGIITINNITANGNFLGSGVYLDNRVSTSNAGISVSGTNVFSDNYHTGLEVYSLSNITLNNVTANNSFGGNGVHLVGFNVTLTGMNTFNGNALSGLKVNAIGFNSTDTIIASSNGTARNLNDAYGANIYAGNVTIGGTSNVFSGNYNTDLRLSSTRGPISIDQITAPTVAIIDSTVTNPSGNGISITNSSVSNLLTLNNVTANNSAGNGLYLMSSGTMNVTFNNFTASSNGGSGAYLNNTIDTVNVTFTGTNTFSGNALNGLKLNTAGDFSSTGTIIASSNGTKHTLTDAYGATINAFSVTIGGTGNVFSSNYADGLYVVSTGTISISNVTASGNGGNGITLIGSSDQSVNAYSILADNNSCIGLQVSGPNNIQGTIISMTGNTIGLLVDNSKLSYNLSGWENIKGNEIVNITGTGADCIAKTIGVTVTNNMVTIPPLIFVMFTLKNQAEFVLDCAHQSQYPVALPNNDLVTINCPVSGKAIIKRLDSTMLPGDLPAGYSYSSAFSLEVVQSGNAIRSIEEGGNVVVSFNVPNTQMGTTYSVLYWDADKKNWTPLKDFLLDENGNPRVFDLYPNDSRRILSGLNFVQDGETLRAELTTNFPGIFVLVQR